MLRDQRGFTLLEVMVAGGILTIGILGLLGFSSSTIKGNAGAERVATATLLAQDKIEQTREAGYNASLTANTTVTEAYGSIPNYPLYQRVTLTQVNTPVTGMQTVTTTVSWNAAWTLFVPTSVTLSTLLTP
jgi:prepilin-type N-terminal cleavage/methylation domain-containing protein